MSKELTLKIIGPSDSFKSTVASLIEQVLTNYNCHVLATGHGWSKLRPTALVELLKGRPTIHIEIIQVNKLPVGVESDQKEDVDPRHFRQLKEQLEIANTKNKDLHEALVEVQQQLSEIKDRSAIISSFTRDVESMLDSASSTVSDIDDEANVIEDELSTVLDVIAELTGG